MDLPVVEVYPELRGVSFPCLHLVEDRVLGDLHLSLGKLGKAVHYLEKAVEQGQAAGNNQTLSMIWNNAGNALAVINEYKGALAAYGECLAILDES